MGIEHRTGATIIAMLLTLVAVHAYGDEPKGDGPYELRYGGEVTARAVKDNIDYGSPTPVASAHLQASSALQDDLQTASAEFTAEVSKLFDELWLRVDLDLNGNGASAQLIRCEIEFDASASVPYEITPPNNLPSDVAIRFIDVQDGVFLADQGFLIEGRTYRVEMNPGPGIDKQGGDPNPLTINWTLRTPNASGLALFRWYADATAFAGVNTGELTVTTFGSAAAFTAIAETPDTGGSKIDFSVDLEIQGQTMALQTHGSAEVCNNCDEGRTFADFELSFSVPAPLNYTYGTPFGPHPVKLTQNGLELDERGTLWPDLTYVLEIHFELNSPAPPINIEWSLTGDFTDCFGACCFPAGHCELLCEDSCETSGGTYIGDGTLCPDVTCPPPTGACCLPGGMCLILDADACNTQGGTYAGDGAGCTPNPCPQPPTPPSLRSNHGQKGSLLIFPKVEVRWAPDGQTLTHDTFISLTNDYPAPVRVLMFFINGDDPLPAIGSERAHPGWNFLDVEITLTGDQPVSWSAATGLGTIPVSPFTALDPGTPVGRPDPVFGGRMIRGTIYAFAVDAAGAQINWNHLSGSATRVLYQQQAADEHGAAAFHALANVPLGARVGTPGILQLNGLEYAQAPSLLLYQFAAHGSVAWSTSTAGITHLPELTLQPVSADLRLNSSESEGPVTVKAQFDVWNENETKFSGAYRCLTCWDQALLNTYFSAVDHFNVMTLQTDHGKARIDGTASPDCFGSVNDPLLGVAVRYLRPPFAPMAGVPNGGPPQPGAPDFGPAMTTASPLFGMGYQPATIRFDQIQPPPEAPSKRQLRGVSLGH